jgi:hypothetical protein
MMGAVIYQLVLLGLFLAAVGLPSTGEYSALYALYVGRGSSLARTVSLLGALMAGAIVIAPLAYTTLKVLFPVALFSSRTPDGHTVVKQDSGGGK